MRSSQKSGRSRGKGNRGGGGKQQGHSPNRVYESAGPEGKVRGTPQQIIDKYSALARDAQLSGDRVAAENFLQHAEHYARILIAVQEAQAERREQHQQNQNQQPQGGHENGGGEQPGGQRNDRQEARRNETEDEQPSSDGLGAIEAAQEQPNIVETPESKSEAPKPRVRRSRPKPPAEAAESADAPTETAAE